MITGPWASADLVSKLIMSAVGSERRVPGCVIKRGAKKVSVHVCQTWATLTQAAFYLFHLQQRPDLLCLLSMYLTPGKAAWEAQLFLLTSRRYKKVEEEDNQVKKKKEKKRNKLHFINCSWWNWLGNVYSFLYIASAIVAYLYRSYFQAFVWFFSSDSNTPHGYCVLSKRKWNGGEKPTAPPLKKNTPCVPPTIRFDPRVMHCGRKWTPPPLPHVFAVHRHNDNNSCDSTRRRPLLCSASWYTEREWQVWKIGKQCLLEGFLGAWVPFEIMCECRGVWMKNSCVILPCCFCQERVIFYLSFPLSLLLPPSLPQLAVILICPSKLTSFSSFPFSPLSLRFSSSLF